MPGPLSLRQKMAFLAFALGILCLSLGVSLYLLWPSGPESASGQPASPEEETYGYISLSEAHHACEQRVRREFGERIWVLVLDKLSTRLDRDEGLYKVFMEMELFASEARQGPVRTYYINCFTGVRSPRIVNFEYSDDGGELGEEDGETGLFGL